MSNIIKNINNVLATVNFSPEWYVKHDKIKQSIDNMKKLFRTAYLPRSIEIIKFDEGTNHSLDYLSKFLYITVKYTPEDDRLPLHYVIYCPDVDRDYNKFKIYRSEQKGEPNIDSEFVTWAETENYPMWTVKDINEEVKETNIKKYFKDIIPMLYEFDIDNIQKTIEKKQRKEKEDYEILKRQENNKKTKNLKPKPHTTAWENEKSKVYDRGNKWEIENWESTQE